MGSVQFTDRDRDDRGFIKAPAEPRSLADLLPAPEPRPQDTARQPLHPRRDIAITSICLLLLALAMLAIWPTRPPTAPAAPASPSAAAGAPTSPPVRATHLLVAFAAPNGVILGAIESTRAITPTAHYHDDWIQADVAGSGLVWLRAADMPGIALTGADLAPRPTAEPVYVAAPEPVYVRAPEPVYIAPPTAEPCASAGIPGKMVQVCGSGDLASQAQAKWIETYGGNVGIVGQPSPQPIIGRHP